MKNEFFDFSFPSKKPNNQCDILKLVFDYSDKYAEKLTKEYGNKRPIPISNTADFVYKLIYDRIKVILDIIHKKSERFRIELRDARDNSELEKYVAKLLEQRDGVYANIVQIFQGIQRTELVFRDIDEISKNESAFSKRIDEILGGIESGSLKNGYRKVFLCASEERLKNIRDFIKNFMANLNKSKFSVSLNRIGNLFASAKRMPLMGLTTKLRRFAISKTSIIRRSSKSKLAESDKKSGTMKKRLSEELKHKLKLDKER